MASSNHPRAAISAETASAPHTTSWATHGRQGAIFTGSFRRRAAAADLDRRLADFPPENAEVAGLRAQVHNYVTECGCALGGAFFVLSAVAALVLLTLEDAWGPWTLLLSLVSVVGASLLGKAVGIGVATVRAPVAAPHSPGLVASRRGLSDVHLHEMGDAVGHRLQELGLEGRPRLHELGGRRVQSLLHVADEGSSRCSTWADEGSNNCISWSKCHWYTPWNCIAGFFCRAYYWVAKWVCKAWYWVAKWVCKAWYWVAKWVCKAWAWVVKAVCVVVSWVAQLVCVAWDWLRCAIRALLLVVITVFGGRPSSSKVQHVFVLMLENRSFDHVFGLSGLEGIGIDGSPTTINGADPSRDSNVDPASGVTFAVGPGADFALKGVDADPGHEFENTVVALCGNGVTYPTSHIYPAINNSGFIANYRRQRFPKPRADHALLRAPPVAGAKPAGERIRGVRQLVLVVAWADVAKPLLRIGGHVGGTSTAVLPPSMS